MLAATGSLDGGLNKVFGPAASTPTDEIVTVHSGHGLIYLVTPDSFGDLHPDLDLVLPSPPAMVLLSIGVNDIARTVAVLAANGVGAAQGRPPDCQSGGCPGDGVGVRSTLGDAEVLELPGIVGVDIFREQVSPVLQGRPVGIGAGHLAQIGRADIQNTLEIQFSGSTTPARGFSNAQIIPASTVR